ncbi:hypothetical protein NL532_30265 [Mesorhizobium sp. C120A]|uniref:hypothetical protein n=1 Tax=Mesorhizobium sp. C120A TaxID=2956824 RepID=UPI0025767518|nr:hypothetical protein [Mesorhizobium sp. C120A]WJI48332.1 hypothetical protein NL532_30265 [Mesorhizobium sp. C120A]
MSDEVDNGQMKKEWFRVPTVVQQIETPRSTDPIMRPCADREEKRVTHGATTTGKESRRSLTSNPNQRSLPGADRPGPLDLDVVEANEERVDAFQTTPSSAARISESNRFERNFFAQRATVPNVAIRSGVFICPWWRQHPISADLLRQCLKGELEHDNLSTRPH